MFKIITNLLLYSLICLSLFACVSKGTYEDVVNQKNGLEKQVNLLTKDQDELKRALKEMQEREKEQQMRLKEFRDLTARFKTLIDAGTLSVRIVDGKMVVSLGSDVLFPSGSAKLSPEGTLAIRDVTQQLIAIPGKRYQIEGHTDNVPISTAAFPSNWELASARALNVVKRMIELKMPAERVSAASFGSSQPVASNDTAEGKAANRRIEIVIVPDLSSLPGYQELQQLSQKQEQQKVEKKTEETEKK